MIRLSFALLAIGLSVDGQNSVSSLNSTGVTDFSGSTSTKPAKTGASLPVTCSVGEQFYLTSAPAGQNLYGCTSLNTWTLQSGGSTTVSANAIKNANAFVTAGVGTAYTGCPTTVPSSLVAYQVFLVTFNTASTSTTPTLNICTLGAKTLIHADGSPLASGEVGTSGYCNAFYDGTSIQLSGTCLTGPGRILITCGTAPGTPSAGIGDAYCDSTSKNLAIKDDAGVVKHGVQTKTVVSSNFVTGISDAGLVSAAQPSASDLSNGVSGTGAVCLASGSSCSAGGGLTVSTNGLGYFCIVQCMGAASAAAAMSSKVPVYIQFVLPWTQKFTTMALYLSVAVGSGCGGNPCGFAAAIMDSTCTKIAGSDVTTTTGAGAVANLFTFPAPPTLSPGIYYMGIVTDSAVATVYGIQGGTVFESLANLTGNGGLRHFTGATSATGANGTLAMPGTCGTPTADTSSFETITVFP